MARAPNCPIEVLMAINETGTRNRVEADMERWLKEVCGPLGNCCSKHHGCYSYGLREPSCTLYHKTMSNAVRVENGKIYTVNFGVQNYQDASGSIERQLFFPAKGKPVYLEVTTAKQQNLILSRAIAIAGPLLTLDSMAKSGLFRFMIEKQGTESCLRATATRRHPFLRGSVNACQTPRMKNPLRFGAGILSWNQARNLALKKARSFAGRGKVMGAPQRLESWNLNSHANKPFSEIVGKKKQNLFYIFAFRVYANGPEYDLLVRVDALTERVSTAKRDWIGSRAQAREIASKL